MNNPLIQNRDRWLAVGLLVLLVILVIVVVLMPLISITNDYQESIEEVKFRLESDRRLASKKPALLRRVAHIKRQRASSNNFFSRKSTALASADLQNKVKSTVTVAGGDLTSTQVIPGHEEDKFRRIGIRVRMSGNLEVLRSVLYELESARPMLIIENLNVRSVRGRHNRITRKIEPSSTLNVNFEVVGYMRI